MAGSSDSATELFHHVGVVELVAEPSIVFADPDAGDDRHAAQATLSAGDAFRFFHQPPPKPLVLDRSVPALMKRQVASIRMELSHEPCALQDRKPPPV